MNSNKISQYYDTMLPFYRLYFGTSYGFHAGYFDARTRSKKEAVLNVNRFLADKAGIKDGDYILDAGCGIGGSCIWLTQNYNVKAVGISNSKKQIKLAKNIAGKLKLSKKTDFYLMDYQKTSFQKSQFDVIWAIESVCYAAKKSDFLKEAHRILKKGGRLILADGFLLREPKGDKETLLLRELLSGYALENISSTQSFKKDLEKTNFKKIKQWEKTNDILPWLNNSRKMLIPLALITEKLKLTPSSLTGTLRAGEAIRESIQRNLLSNCVFYAEK